MDTSKYTKNVGLVVIYLLVTCFASLTYAQTNLQINNLPWGGGARKTSFVIAQNLIANNANNNLIIHTVTQITEPYPCPIKTIKDFKVFGKLSITEDFISYNLPFTMSFTATFNCYKNGNTSILQSFSKDFSVSNTNPEAMAVLSLTNEYTMYDEIKVVLTNVNITGTLPTNAYTFNCYYEERFTIDVSFQVDGSPSVTNIGIDKTTDYPNVKLSWSDCYGTENYQVQILRLYNKDASKYSTPTSIVADVDWSKALTIETGSATKEISLMMVEGSGYYIWRVRPIGNKFDAGIADPRNYGAWSISNSEFDADEPIGSEVTNKIFYFEQNDSRLNWIYSRVFSEGDPNGQSQFRIKEQISYANGLLQAQQSQVKNQTQENLGQNNSIFASQTVYDYNGRPSLTTLAAPTGSDRFAYNNNFMLSSSNTPYTSADFDSDTKVKNPTPVYSTSPLVQYYDGSSDLNIPSSEGLPFSRTIFTSDGSNRPAEVSSPGSTFNFGGKTSKVVYTTVSDKELIRIFGDEAPANSGVSKIITTDANNLSTVSYQAKDGLTLATCVDAASQTPNLDPISGYNGDAFTIVDDVIRHNEIISPTKISSSYSIYLSTNQTIKLNYQISPKLYQQLCANICKVCDYKVTITVMKKTDPFNVDKELYSTSYSIGPDDFTSPCSTEVKTYPEIPLTRGPGEYIIIRTIEAYTSNTSGVNYYEKEKSDLEYLIDYHSTSQTLSIGVDNPIWVVKYFLNNSNLTGLYSYLDGLVAASKCERVPADINLPVTHYKLNFISNSSNCNKITIPYKKCEEITPIVNYYNYFEDYWAERNYAYTHSEYDNTTKEVIDIPITILHGLNSNGKMNILPNYTPTEFNDLISRMIADPYCSGYYTNIKLSKAWITLVTNYGQLQRLTSNSIQSGTMITNNSNPNMPTSKTYNIDLMNEFLNSVGRRIRYFSDVAISTSYVQPGYISHPYACFKHPGILDKYEDCQRIAEGVVSQNPPPTPKTDVNQFVNAYLISGQTDFEMWASYYNCVVNSLPGTFTSQTQAKPYFWEFEEKQHATSEKECEAKLDAFMGSVAQKIHDNSPDFPTNPTYISGYDFYELEQFSDLVIPNQFHYYPSDNILSPTFTPAYSKDYDQLYCYAMAMVKHCKDNTKLYYQKTVINGDTVYGNFGTEEEMDNASLILNGNYEIELSNDCSDGFTRINCPSYDFFGMYIEFLNRRIKQLRREKNYTLDWNAVLNSVFGSNQMYSSNCTTSTVITLNKYDSYFRLVRPLTGNTYYLLFMQYNPANQTYTIAKQYDFTWAESTLTSGDCNMCIRYFMPDPITAPTITNTTCEFEICSDLSLQIASQIADIRNSYLNELEYSYKSNCLNQNTIDDQLTVTYTLNYHQYTLYYYDRAGNLIKTVPPKGVDLTCTNRAQHPNHTFVTEYDYNSLGQLIRQSTPDGGESEFYYNSLNQLRFSQNQQQVKDGKFSYTKYDILGRIIETGECKAILPSGYTKTMAEEIERYYSTYGDLNEYPKNETATTGVQFTISQLTINKYTEPYPGLSYGSKTQRFLNNNISYTYSDEDGILTTTKDQWFTFFSYDPHGNVEWMIQQDPILGRSTLAYEYDLINNHVLKVKYNEYKSDAFFHRYKYDADGRIVMAETSSDQLIWDRDARYEYYLHGPLKRVLLGEDRIQGIDFVYTIQGWLKGINHSSLNAAFDPGKDGESIIDPNNPNIDIPMDVYGMILSYFKGDFKHTSSPFENTASSLINYASASELFNGNIAAWESNINSSSVSNANLVRTGLTGRVFRYDQLNRLMNADFYASSFSAGQYTWQTTEDFDESFTYDQNGNIHSLSRNGNSTVSIVMDRFQYKYKSENTNNKLDYVADDIGNSLNYPNDVDNQSAGNYTYDDIGNLISDNEGNIQLIEWNAYGKVAKITKRDNSYILFHYDAFGNRICKEHHPVATSGQDVVELFKSTYYVRDASGNVMATYERYNTKNAGTNNYTAHFKLEEYSLYGSDRLGVLNSAMEVKTKIFTTENDVYITNFNSGIGTNLNTGSPLFTAKVSSTSINYDNANYNSLVSEPQIVQTSSTAVPTINPSNFVLPGLVGNNRCVAQDEYGNNILYFDVYKQLNGAKNQGILRNSIGEFIFNSEDIYCDANGQSYMIQHPANANQYLLFTSYDGKLYSCLIDKENNKVIEKNRLIDNGTGQMALLNDKTGAGNSQLYYVHSNTDNNKTEIKAISITDDGTGSPRVLKSISDNASSKGNLCISNDAKYLAFSPLHKKSIFVVRKGETANLYIYNISTDHSTLTDKQTISGASNVYYDKLCFSPNSVYLYFTEKSQQGDSYLKRMALSSGAVSQPTYTQISGAVFTGSDNSLYAVIKDGASTKLLKLSNCEAASPTSSQPYTLQGIGAAAQISIHNSSTYGAWILNNAIFVRSIGKKLYELKDHLGNVNVTIRDIKTHQNGSLTPTIVSISSYYAFGSEMPNMCYSTPEYRYGFNGQEKDDEIAGSGNFNTAMYWEYDSRIGRRWNRDPVMKEWESSYACFSNNPIFISDVNGDDGKPTFGINASATMTFYLGSGSNRSYWNLSGNINAFSKTSWGQADINYTFNIKNGGIGMPNGTASNNPIMFSGLFLTGTIGSQQDVTLPIQLWHNQTEASMYNSFKYSFSYSMGWLGSSDPNVNASQRVGVYTLRIDDGGFSTYEDHIFWGGDKGDKFLGTGGLNIFAYKENIFYKGGFDIMTGNSKPKVVLSESEEQGAVPDIWNDNISRYNASQSQFDYINTPGYNTSLNMGRIYTSRLNLKTGCSQTLAFTGKSAMYPQNFIHDLINFHWFLSNVPDNLEINFQEKPQIKFLK